MNISGIRPYEGFYEYNSIKQTNVPEQMHGVADVVFVSEENTAEVQVAAPAGQPGYTSYDFAQTYRAGESYELKGLDSDIYSLDTQKAVSDLDKDQVLRQYQYFVGSSSDVIAKPVDSQEKLLRSGENFSL